MQTNTYALDATWPPILRDLGISAANVLRRAGLPEDLLAQSSLRLEAADFYRFWNGIEAELDDPVFPLRLCNTIKSESFSPLLFAALCSPNFGVAAQRIARYKTLVAPMRLDIRKDDDTETLSLIWPEASDNHLKPPPSLVMAELLFFVSLARIGTRETIRPLRIVTDNPPIPADPYENFLGIRIQRGTGHHICFKKSDMQMPFLTSNDGIWAAFEPELRTRLAELKTEVEVAQRVRSVLLESLPSGLISMNTIASRLAMSRRTLQRRLEAEGTTYLLLLQQTREALARHYLQKTALTAGEIAFLLGFDEPNSFYRAFRAWTGHSPEQIRHPAHRTEPRYTQTTHLQPPLLEISLQAPQLMSDD